MCEKLSANIAPYSLVFLIVYSSQLLLFPIIVVLLIRRSVNANAKTYKKISSKFTLSRRVIAHSNSFR